MGWDGLNPIEDVEPLRESDETVLREVREVLAKHGALERFGVMLLHSHFHLEPDEVLVEKVDVDARTLTTRPVHRNDPDVAGSLTPTSFRLDGSGAVPVTVTYCHRPPNSQFHAC